MTVKIDRLGVGLLALGLALRLGYAAYAYKTGLTLPANDGYEAIALNLVEHGRYAGLSGRPEPTAAREPVLPLLIAGLYSVFGRAPFAVLAAQALLNTAACALLSAAAGALFGPLAARIALALSVAYPYFIFYTGYFYRESVLSLAVALLVFLAERMTRGPSPRSAALAGLAAGLCAVTLSTYLAVCAALAVWSALYFRRRARGAALWGAFIAGMALLPGLWIGRNFLVFHRFIPGSTLGGFNLYTALVVPEEHRGTPQEWVYERNDPHWDRLHGMSSLYSDDGSQQEAFLKASRERIAKDPGAYLVHVAKQARKLWRPYPYERKYQHDYSLIKAASLLSDGWMIPLGLLGFFLYWRSSPVLAAYATVLVSATAGFSLVSAIVRYRLPLMIPMMILSSAVLAGGWRQFAGRKGP